MPPTSATGSVRNIRNASLTLWKAACSRNRISDRRADAHLQQAVLGRLSLGSLAEQLEVVADGQLDLREPRAERRMSLS